MAKINIVTMLVNDDDYPFWTVVNPPIASWSWSSSSSSLSSYWL